MQFITNGPEIPERLLQIHEEGRVVFFCGAGISIPSGLPLFSGLVSQIFQELEETPTAIEQAAIRAGQFDTAIGLLEQPTRIAGGREYVRQILAKILLSGFSTPKATATHEALLTLSRRRDGRTHLITTNFDRMFEAVIASRGLAVERFQAPLLPVPKNRWDGLVYLHGLLSAAPTPTDLDRLVVSSGDFGLAYLTERWAARFVSELFRNYTVCFIGYSINDPVLRYMMDALAADRLLGESPPEMFAFGSYTKGKEVQRYEEWRAKNVTPILYHEHKNHSYLHNTLKEWANTYRDGVGGKEMIIAKHATAPPLTPSRLDYAVGRVLWALTDRNAAKHFAYFNPVPPIEWLEPLSQRQFLYEDLPRFGVIPLPQKDDKLSFSFTQRPAAYTHAPLMCLVNMGDSRDSKFDPVMFYLSVWLTRHLNDPSLVLWLCKQGGQLHEVLSGQIKQHIENIEKLEQEGKVDEIANLISNAPNAIPGPPMRTIWSLLLSRRIKSQSQNFNLFHWAKRFKQQGLTATLRIELREILSPRVVLRRPLQFGGITGESHPFQRIKDLVDWEIVLCEDHVSSGLEELHDSPHWQAAQPELLQDFTGLLCDTLDLMRELEAADDKSDLSYIHHPSIGDHPQNNEYHDDWAALITLTRDSWLAMKDINLELAQAVVEVWRHIPYPIFKRFVFYASAQPKVIAPNIALDWLLTDRSWWLWSVETQHEVLRLLDSLVSDLDASGLAKLEQAIMDGPPREMFRKDLDPGEWPRIFDRSVWLLLARIQKSTPVLGQTAKEKLADLKHKYPEWQLATDERDEFPVWMSNGADQRKYLSTPRLRRDLVEWLKKHPNADSWQEDDWSQRCRDSFPVTSCALISLAQDDLWPSDRWRQALQAWEEGKLLKRSWRYMAQCIANAPDEKFALISNGLGMWLKSQAKEFEGEDELFFSLAKRLLDLHRQDPVLLDDDPVFRAINHPVGYVTEALLRWWYRQEPKDGQGLSEELKSVLSLLTDTQVEVFRYGRVLLAAHVIALFRVDEDWATTHLLPLFEWQFSEVEAQSAWEGFLWSPRLHMPFIAAIRKPFIETASHFSQLGKHSGQYASYLTYAALELSEIFSKNELAQATRVLPEEGLRNVARVLVNAVESAGEQRAAYWHNRVLPYLKSVWPKSNGVINFAIAERLASLCIVSAEAFPEAWGQLKYQIKEITFPDSLVRKLNETNICSKFPLEALDFLDVLIVEPQWITDGLSKCLDDIKGANARLADDGRFQRLAALLKQFSN